MRWTEAPSLQLLCFRELVIRLQANLGSNLSLEPNPLCYDLPSGLLYWCHRLCRRQTSKERSCQTFFSVSDLHTCAAREESSAWGTLQSSQRCTLCWIAWMRRQLWSWSTQWRRSRSCCGCLHCSSTGSKWCTRRSQPRSRCAASWLHWTPTGVQSTRRPAEPDSCRGAPLSRRRASRAWTRSGLRRSLCAPSKRWAARGPQSEDGSSSGQGKASRSACLALLATQATVSYVLDVLDTLPSNYLQSTW